MLLIKNLGGSRRVNQRALSNLAREILGPKYELSLVLCGNALSRRLNRQYRGKNKPANVLAFPLSPPAGEIFLNVAGRDNGELTHLFIHALLHLKGYRHGSIMERHEQKHRDRYRRRILFASRGGGRIQKRR